MKTLQLPVIIKENGYCGYGKDEENGLFFNMENDKVIGSHSCRESFSEYYQWNLDNGQYDFCFGLDKPFNFEKNLEAFWFDITRKLGEKFGIKVFPTQFPHLFLIQPGDGWVENKIVFELLTLFIRWSFCYYNGDWEQSFSLYHYASFTKLAIEHFLNGNTKPTFTEFTFKPGYGVGWVCEFRFLNEIQIAAKLIKP